MKKILFIAALILTGSSVPAFALCVNPSGTAGTQMYNATHNVMQYCNGTSWISMDGSYTGIPGPELDNLGNHSATENLDMGGFKVQELATPTANTDAATKAYIDGKVGAAETDPQIGTITDTKLCKGNGTAVNCTFDPPAAQTLSYFFATDEKANSTDAGAATTNTWAVRALTTIKKNDIGASLAGNQITLQPGVYYVDAVIPFVRVGLVRTRLINVTSGALAIAGTALQTSTDTAAGNASGASFIRGVIGITSAASFRIEYFTIANSGSVTQGQQNAGNGNEVYAYVMISRIASAASVSPPIPDCAGSQIGAQCWYLGSTNQSCDTVCASHGGCQDSPIIDFTGNAGTNANCAAVLNVLTGSSASVSDSTSTSNNYERLGCNILSGNRYRFTAASTTCGDAYSTVQRACACRN